jgi:aminoglycoside phosphotransferase (APT) family kinase protein
MNAILARWSEVRDRSDVDRLDLGANPSCVLLTPRFRTSRHVVALLIPDGAAEPRFVVKTPRLAGDGDGIAREARVLLSLRETSPDVAASLPEVVAWVDGEHPLLVQTALIGPPMSSRTLRSNPSRWIDEVVSWLTRMPRSPSAGAAAFDELIEEPLSRFADLLPDEAPERTLVARTLEIVEPLRAAEVPRVVEHGDLSHPNLILLPAGRVGVVDWELAEEEGFPLHDLSFFLAFATFALRYPRQAKDHVRAFDDAFFRQGGSARPRMAAYADRLELDEALLAPLFVACWARYTARLAVRIGGDAAGLTDESAAWLRENRYYRLWNHTVENVSDLALER